MYAVKQPPQRLYSLNLIRIRKRKTWLKFQTLRLRLSLKTTEVDEDINGFTHEKKFNTVALTCLEGGGFDPL